MNKDVLVFYIYLLLPSSIIHKTITHRINTKLPCFLPDTFVIQISLSPLKKKKIDFRIFITIFNAALYFNSESWIERLLNSFVALFRDELQRFIGVRCSLG